MKTVEKGFSGLYEAIL